MNTRKTEPCSCVQKKIQTRERNFRTNEKNGKLTIEIQKKAQETPQIFGGRYMDVCE